MWISWLPCLYVYPLAKAVKCFKLEYDEGIDNDMVALFEIIIVIIICGIIGYDFKICWNGYIYSVNNNWLLFERW